MKRLLLLAVLVPGCGSAPPTEAQKRTLWMSPVGGVIAADTTNVICWKDEKLQALSAARGTVAWAAELAHVRPECATSDAVFYRAGGEAGNIVVAVNMRDGSERWRFRAEDASSVHASGERVFACERAGVHFKLHALDLQEGKPAWTAEADALTTQLTTDETRVYITDQAGYVAAHALEDGRRAWRAAFGKQAFDRLVVAGGRVLVNAGAPQRELIAYDAETGAEAWRWKRGWGTVAAWQRSGDIVYYIVGMNIFAIDAKTGERVWDAPCKESAVATAGALFVATLDGLRALDARSGLMRWEAPKLERAVYADGEIVAAASDRFMSLLDASTGRELWRLEGPSEIRAARRSGPLLVVESYDQPEARPGQVRPAPVRHMVFCMRISD